MMYNLYHTCNTYYNMPLPHPWEDQFTLQLVLET
jgi:hypothetical protein